jgi:uncharacterized protein YfiM (DUF2279 family)
MDELIRVALALALGGLPGGPGVAPSMVADIDAVNSSVAIGPGRDAAVLVAPAQTRPLVAPDVALSHPAQQQRPVPVEIADAWFGSDKFRHFWMSYATTAFAFAAGRAAGQDTDAALWVAVPVAGAAGLGKEIYDRRTGGIFSVRDLVADALGVAAGYFLLREVR